MKNTKNYPDYKYYAVSKLKQQSYNWTITNRPQPNLKLVCNTLIKDCFAVANLKPATLVAALKDKKKDYLIGLTKGTDLIKKLVDKNLYSLLNNKSAAKIWTFFKIKFQHISPMSIIRIFYKVRSIKLSDCKDVINYISCYQMAFNKIESLITKDLWISKRTVEIILQKSLFQYLKREYLAVISIIKIM